MLRRVLPIYLIIFIDVLGFTFLIPLLPALASKFHASSVTMGLLISTTAACAAISSPFWGKLSDRAGRRIVLVASQGFSLVGYLLLAVAGSVPVLFVSRAIEGLGGGNLGVAQSYIVDSVREDQREKALAWGAAAFGLGFVIGPVMSGLLARGGLSVPFWVATGFEALNIVLTVLMLPKTRPHDEATDLSGVFATVRRPAIVNVLVRQFLYIFSYTYFFTVFALYLQKALHVGASGSSLLLGLAGATGALAQVVLADRLSKRFGTFVLSESMFGVSLVAYALLGFVTNVWWFVAVLVVWAIPGAILLPTMNALIAERAPEDQRGAVLGFADSLNNASMIVAPAAGAAVVSANVHWVGLLPAACALTAIVLGLTGGAKRPAASAARSASA
jgi:DHA1 family tetracycline resistance protein-like MFS transporter